ncbi:MAG: universal stress protein [Hyphomonadaceae bacterium]
MSYQSIITVASGLESDLPLLAAAAGLARQCGAQVRVLPAYPDIAAALVSFGAALKGGSDELSERLLEGQRVQQHLLERRVSEAAARAGVAFGPRPEGGAIYVDARALIPAAALAEGAALADLVMFSGDAARDALALGAAFAETLLAARAPVLLVKDDQFSPGAIAVAWDGSAQAGRAVRAAAPLLRLANEIVVVQNLNDLAEQPRKPASVEALNAYLLRHGVKRVRVARTEGDNVAASLLRAAREAGCGALVAGAYGRPRLYELALGGTTRALVNASDRINLLLAH